MVGALSVVLTGWDADGCAMETSEGKVNGGA